MPSLPATLQVTGLSSTTGFPVWYPDTDIRPFNIGIGVVVISTAVSYNVEHTFDYNGQLSSDFNGFNPLTATWMANTGIASATSNSNGNYAFPVSAIRLNVLSGSSAGIVTATLIQAG